MKFILIIGLKYNKFQFDEPMSFQFEKLIVLKIYEISYFKIISFICNEEVIRNTLKMKE